MWACLVFVSLGGVASAGVPGRTDALVGFTVFGVGADTSGVRWELLSVQYISEPYLGFARFGIGIGLLAGYAPYDLPKVKWADRSWVSYPPERWPNETEYGDLMAVFPLTAYFVPATWRGFRHNFAGGAYLYAEYWTIKHRFTWNVKDRVPKAPFATSFWELGAGVNPFGAMLLIKLFYRDVHIPSGRDVEGPTYTGGVIYMYSFPGFDQSTIGIGAYLNLGAWMSEWF
ncbi:MAG TPA: hypothetical protein ENF73_05945 [Proteobacteria bacterium]|nr:hypothetical protein [Pseudomonadota bacterium]